MFLQMKTWMNALVSPNIGSKCCKAAGVETGLHVQQPSRPKLTAQAKDHMMQELCLTLRKLDRCSSLQCLPEEGTYRNRKVLSRPTAIQKFIFVLRCSTLPVEVLGQGCSKFEVVLQPNLQYQS